MLTSSANCFIIYQAYFNLKKHQNTPPLYDRFNDIRIRAICTFSFFNEFVEH